jgi:predicted phage-related endonuclease
MEIVKIENGQIEIAKEFTKQYKEFLKLQLEMDLKIKEVKEKVKSAMEEYGIASFDNEDLTITYKKGTTRKSVDSKKLKEELPDIYEEYLKESTVASSVIVEVKR